MGELLLLTLESLIFIVQSSIPPPQWLSLSDSTSKLPDSLIVLFIGPKDASTSKVNTVTVYDCSSGCLFQRWGLFHTLHFFNGVCFHRAKLWPTIPTRFHSLMFLNKSVKKRHYTSLLMNKSLIFGIMCISASQVRTSFIWCLFLGVSQIKC